MIIDLNWNKIFAMMIAIALSTWILIWFLEKKNKEKQYKISCMTNKLT